MIKNPKIVPNILCTRNFAQREMLILNQLEPEDIYKYLSFFAFCENKIKFYLIYVIHILYVQ